MITVEDAELATYHQAHTHVAKHKPWAPVTPPGPPAPSTADAPAPRYRVAAPVVAKSLAPPVPASLAPGLEAGRRVSHAVFGDGVTKASSVGHTAVCFDKAGTKTFVTSMLEVDILSEPHTWETTARGTNRPCWAVVPAGPAVLPAEPPRRES